MNIKKYLISIYIYTLMSLSASSSRVPFGGSTNGVRGPTFQSGGCTISARVSTRSEANSIGLRLADRQIHVSRGGGRI